MADKRIQDLTPASSVQTSDRFVLEQSGQAKSLTGQILINDLAAFLDGHGGINDISYTPPSTGSLDGTLTITLADETVETFTVTNGRGIASIGYVESIGLDDYYQIDYNDDSEPTTFVVHNGEKGDTGDDWYVHIKWAAVMPTQDSDMVNYPDDFIGIYSGISSTAPTSYGEYDWYEYKGEKGDTGTGITGVALESSSGLVDTYRVSFDDGTSTTFNVTNGSQIDSITKTSSFGLTDIYAVTLTNGNQTTFQVNNGKSIVSITWTSTTSPTGVPHVPGATDTYTVAYNDGDATTFQVYNGLDGEGASITVDGIPSVNGNVPLLTIDTEHGAPTPQTVGSPKSRYFDAINSVLYICLGYDENNGYLWRGAGVTVDAALSSSSTNPVQNRVITNKIGTAALGTTAQDLSGAVNEILNDISGFADNLAEEYDATATYEVGDLRLHDNTLYRCNTAIATPEAWNSIHWTQTSVDEELDGKVSKSGDTMTGNLTIESAMPGYYVKATDVTDGVAPSADTNQVGFRVTDKNGANIAIYADRENANGQQGAWMAGMRNGVGNALFLLVDSNGNRSVSVTEAAPWRTALNAVNKSGDTMTGSLVVKTSNLERNSTPSSDTYGTQTISVADKNDNSIGVIRGVNTTAGYNGVQMFATNGSSENSLILLVDSSGNRSIGVSDAAVWRKALGLGQANGNYPVLISQGGTSSTGTSSISTVSQIATAASGYTITSAQYFQWGKVAQIRISVKCNTASSASSVQICTLVSGKRPAANITLNAGINPRAFVNASTGACTLYSTTTANTTYEITGTFILP